MIVDLGRVTYTYSVIFNAVREGTRYATIPQSDGTHRPDVDVKNYIRTRVPGLDTSLLADDKITITWSSLDITGEPERVTIAISYDFDPITPFIENILGGGDLFTIGTQSTMNLEL